MEALQRLPDSQYQTAWVRCQIGRAWYELVDFAEAAAAYQQARYRDPGYLEVRHFPLPELRAFETTLCWIPHSRPAFRPTRREKKALPGPKLRVFETRRKICTTPFDFCR